MPLEYARARLNGWRYAFIGAAVFAAAMGAGIVLHRFAFKSAAPGAKDRDACG